MLNHSRTLLVNARADAAASPGDEYIPEDFVPVPLSAGLETVRRIIFGARPDRVMLNYRASQLLGIVHATELSDHLRHFDNRLMYRPFVANLADPAVFRPAVSCPLGHVADLIIAGTPVPPDGTGLTTYKLVVTTGNDENVTITCSTPAPPTAETFAGNFSSRLSIEMPLGKSGYTCRVHKLSHTVSWFVDLLVRPVRTPGDLAADVAVSGVSAMEALFGDTSDATTALYRDIWETARDMPLRVAAMTLALIRQTELRRSTRG